MLFINDLCKTNTKNIITDTYTYTIVDVYNRLHSQKQ